MLSEPCVVVPSYRYDQMDTYVCTDPGIEQVTVGRWNPDHQHKQHGEGLWSSQQMYLTGGAGPSDRKPILDQPKHAHHERKFSQLKGGNNGSNVKMNRPIGLQLSGSVY